VRLIKIIITTVFTASLLTADAAAQQTEADDANELSAYYGFGEIEIVKLDEQIKGLTITDLNGDGRNDIAVINNLKSKIELLIQKENFGPEETEVTVDPQDLDINTINPPSRFKRAEVAVSQKIFSLVSGDLNSDGLTDLAFYGEPRGLYVLLQKSRQKDSKDSKSELEWQSLKKIKIEEGMQNLFSLACGDLTSDGADDLAMAARDAIYLTEQKKDGTLAEPVKYPTTAQVLGIRIGDVNGDGINDLILITDDREKRIHVRFGLKTGQLGPQVKYDIEKPFWLKLYNIDDLPGEEIIIVDSVSSRLMCYKLLSEEQSKSDSLIQFYPLATGEKSNRRDLVVADVDNDGLEDIVISDPDGAELILYKQIKGLGPAEPVRFPAFTDIDSLTAGDIDGDNKTELAVLSVTEKIIGISRYEDNRLTFPKPLDVAGEPLAMSFDDIDNNDKIDCLYIAKDQDDRFLRVLYDVSKALKSAKSGKKIPLPDDADSKKYGPEKPEGLKLEKLTANPDGLKVFDADQDGLLDVLIFVRYEQPIFVRQVKKRQFEVVDWPGAQASLIKNATLPSIAVADVDDNDGKELLVAQKNFARSLVFANAKAWSVVDQYNAQSTENNISAVAAFNLETDKPKSRPAILLLDGQKGQLQILNAGQDKTYRYQKQLDVDKWSDTKHLKMLYAPLTGGKEKSILLFDSEKFAIITDPGKINVPCQLHQQFSYETKIKDGRYGNLAAGDINSDGWTDIVMVEYQQNHIEILALDSENKPAPAMRFKIFEEKSYRGSERESQNFTEPRELTIADVTGDGKNDLVTIIHDRIIVYPQD
jgi:hypothetical protein